MTDAVKLLIQRVDYLQKREAKLTRELARANRRIDHLVHQSKQLYDSVRRALPHMNLDPFLDRLLDNDADKEAG